MTTSTTTDALVPVRSTNLALVRVLSDICFVLGFASILLSIVVWLQVTTPDSAAGERFGIFIGLWAPTFFALSDRLGRYGKPRFAEATTPAEPARAVGKHWGA